MHPALVTGVDFRASYVWNLLLFRKLCGMLGYLSMAAHCSIRMDRPTAQ